MVDPDDRERQLVPVGRGRRIPGRLRRSCARAQLADGAVSTSVTHSSIYTPSSMITTTVRRPFGGCVSQQWSGMRGTTHLLAVLSATRLRARPTTLAAKEAVRLARAILAGQTPPLSILPGPLPPLSPIRGASTPTARAWNNREPPVLWPNDPQPHRIDFVPTPAADPRTNASGRQSARRLRLPLCQHCMGRPAHSGRWGAFTRAVRRRAVRSRLVGAISAARDDRDRCSRRESWLLFLDVRAELGRQDE